MCRKLSVLVVFVVMSTVLKAQISTVSWHDGYWGKWESHTIRYYYGSPSYYYAIFGNYSGFIIYKKEDHPSEYVFKFNINSYNTPDKKTKKYHRKNDLWYEYSGTVEYYVTEEYPTIVDILRKYEFPKFNYNSGGPGNPCVKRTANATIKIAPYKDHPKVYNIYFDTSVRLIFTKAIADGHLPVFD